MKLKKTVEIDKDRYTHVGLDDFAIRRGHTYGTCLVDHETHAVIDMVPTRELQEVMEWLTSWKNPELVTRDGSHAYRAAIRGAHPSCIQAADRFHLAGNVLDSANRTIRSLIPGKVVLSRSSAIADMAEEQQESAPLTESESRRRDRAAKALKMHRAGLTYVQIAQLLSLDRKTVRKYCREDFSPRLCISRKRVGKLDAFREAAAQMAGEGRRAIDIFESLKIVGYKGSYLTVQRYVKALRDSNPAVKAAKAIEKVVERTHLIDLVYHPDTQSPGLPAADLEKVLQRFPDLRNLYEYMDSFRGALFSGSRDQLAEWAARAAGSPFSGLVSAARGIQHDMEAALNAAAYPYSNGVVEGSNTKIKLAKRIMYGRCHFSTLRTKILLREQRRLHSSRCS